MLVLHPGTGTRVGGARNPSEEGNNRGCTQQKTGCGLGAGYSPQRSREEARQEKQDLADSVAGWWSRGDPDQIGARRKVERRLDEPKEAAALAPAGGGRLQGDEEKAEGGAGTWQQLGQGTTEAAAVAGRREGGGEAREEASRRWGLGRGGRGTTGWPRTGAMGL